MKGCEKLICQNQDPSGNNCETGTQIAYDLECSSGFEIFSIEQEVIC